MTMKRLQNLVGGGEYETPWLELADFGPGASVNCVSTGTESFESDDEEYLLLG